MAEVQQEPVSNNNRPSPSEEWPFSFFQFNKETGDADQVRSAILVVAALVATASFQSAMSPPGAITKPEASRITKLFFFYLITLAWSSSMSIIEMLTSSFPFKRELRLAYIAMGGAFGISVSEQADLGQGVAYGIFGAVIFAPWMVRWVPYYIKKLCRRR